MKKLTKINVNPDSLAQQAASVEEYRVDQERGTWGQFFEGKSPPVEYTVIGDVVGDLIVGSYLIMNRHFRSDITGAMLEIDGVMHTSTIKNISQEDGVTYITTANSVYKLEDHTPPTKEHDNSTPPNV